MDVVEDDEARVGLDRLGRGPALLDRAVDREAGNVADEASDGIEMPGFAFESVTALKLSWLWPRPLLRYSCRLAGA